MDTIVPSSSAAPDTTDTRSVVRSRLERNVAYIGSEAVHRIVLENAHGMEVRCLTFGAVIESIVVPDRDAVLADVVLGFDTVEEYFADRCYFGAVIGRYANRIGGARFQLDGRQYDLDTNDGPHHLHGGSHGFHARVWDLELPATLESGCVRLTMHSPHGEGGYPGTITMRVTYTLTPTNALVVDYEATTDRATPFSPTQHSYFNLAGGGHDILGHRLTIPASHMTPVDATLIPTGELRPVEGTAFDFRTPHAIGARIASRETQMRYGDGYDHNFALDVADTRHPQLAARLDDDASGRRLEVFTTAPGMQLCTGNALHQGIRGKQQQRYGLHAGVALETQHYPDAPNQPAFPSAILRPGERFHSRTIFQFSVAPTTLTAPATPSQSP